MCRYVDEGERAFFAWVSMESCTADEAQAQLRARRGMRTRRTRRLVEAAGEGHVMTTVTRHAVLGARTALRERTSPGRCRACAAADSTVSRSIGIVLDGLSDPSHVRLDSAHSDMRFPHVVEAAGRCQRGPLKLIAERPAEWPRRPGADE